MSATTARMSDGFRCEPWIKNIGHVTRGSEDMKKLILGTLMIVGLNGSAFAETSFKGQVLEITNDSSSASEMIVKFLVVNGTEKVVAFDAETNKLAAQLIQNSGSRMLTIEMSPYTGNSQIKSITLHNNIKP